MTQAKVVSGERKDKLLRSAKRLQRLLELDAPERLVKREVDLVVRFFWEKQRMFDEINSRE